MPEVTIPLRGTSESTVRYANTRGLTAPDQHWINFYTSVQRSSFDGSSRSLLIARPSVKQSSISFSTVTAPQGIYHWARNAFIYAMWDGTLYRVDAAGGTVTSVGALAGFTGGAHFEEFYDGTNHLLIITDDGTNAWQVTTAHVVTKFANATFTGHNRVGLCVAMGGRLFHMNALGQVLQSDLNSATNHTAGAYWTVDSYPGDGISICRYGSYIFALKQFSCELLYDARKSTGTILAPVPNMAFEIGCPNFNTLKVIGGTPYFVGISKDLRVGVYRLSGNTPDRVSTDEIESEMVQSIHGYGIWGAFSTSFNGHTFYCLNVNRASNNGSDKFTLAYDISNKSWHHWGIYSSADAEWNPIANNSAGNNVGNLSTINTSATTHRVLIQGIQPGYASPGTATTGYLYQFDDQNNVDSEQALYVVQTAKLRLGAGKRVVFDKIELLGDYPGASASVSIAWSDDDYQTFTTADAITNDGGRVMATHCGAARARAIRITQDCSVVGSSGLPTWEALRIEYRVLSR